MDSSNTRPLPLPLFQGPITPSSSIPPAPGLAEVHRWEYLGAARGNPNGPRQPGGSYPSDPTSQFNSNYGQEPPRTGDRYPPYCNVYVAGLPLTLNEDGLLEIGQKFGQVIELKLLTEVAARKHHRTLSGFLRYSKRSESDKCISCESHLTFFHVLLFLILFPFSRKKKLRQI